jgi:hypothetical protein
MYRDVTQAIFVFVIMLDYKALFFCVCVIILFSFFSKPAHTTTNITFYWVHNTFFSDPWVLLLLATTLIYPSDSPMRFSEISPLNKYKECSLK